MLPLSRREFLTTSAALAVAPALPAQDRKDALFKISLAQWSHNKAFFAFLKKRPGDPKDPLRFAEIAKKEYGIDAIEYVNQFYDTKKKDAEVEKIQKRFAQ